VVVAEGVQAPAVAAPERAAAVTAPGAVWVFPARSSKQQC
jgi:hypothetical protein